MSASTDLRALLVGSAGVTALVGQRVRFERAEQTDVRPYVVLQLTDTENEYSLSGALLASKAILTAQCWADTRVAADAVAAAVKAVCIAHQRAVAGPLGEYLADLDLEAAVLTVDWWDD